MKNLLTLVLLMLGFGAFCQEEKSSGDQCIRLTDHLQIDRYDTTYVKNDTTFFVGEVWVSGKYIVKNAAQVMIYQNNERLLVVSPEKVGGFKRVVWREMEKGAEVHAVMFDKNLTVIWSGETETERFIFNPDYDFSDYDMSMFGE